MNASGVDRHARSPAAAAAQQRQRACHLLACIHLSPRCRYPYVPDATALLEAICRVYPQPQRAAAVAPAAPAPPVRQGPPMAFGGMGGGFGSMLVDANGGGMARGRGI